MLISGMYVTISRVIIITMNIGSSGFITSSIFTFGMLQPDEQNRNQQEVCKAYTEISLPL